MKCQLLLGDCLDKLKEIADNSVDSVVTDPPYGISFFGKKWDCQVPGVEIWKEVLRVLKPGGHLLAFAGTRTQHRMAVNIEDAGFEIRDMLAWVYGSGFPKSMNIGIAVDKLTGGNREQGDKNSAYREKEYDWNPGGGKTPLRPEYKTVGTSEWEGWGTALKPALEPITLARKPIDKGLTIAANILRHRTGGLNIDGCRVSLSDMDDSSIVHRALGKSTFSANAKNWDTLNLKPAGRFPANLIHDGSDEVMVLFPETTSGKLQPHHATGKNPWVASSRPAFTSEWGGDSGSAARFFYCAKASKADRNEGCERIITWENVELNEKMELALQQAKGIFDFITNHQAGLECSMTLFGKKATEQYPMGMMSTILMVTNLIMKLKTLNFSLSSITKDCILGAARTLTENGSSPAEIAACLNSLIPNTTKELMGSLHGAVAAVLKTLYEIKGLGRTGNFHATVKPTALMQYLCRLITPPNGIVLDPFMGSGSTGKAALLENFHFIGIEKDAEYMEIARCRIIDSSQLTFE